MTFTGQVIEIGNVQGGKVPGVVIEDDLHCSIAITGLTQDEARELAQAWAKDEYVTLTIERKASND